MSKFNFLRARRLHLAAMVVATGAQLLPKTIFIEWVEEKLQRYDEGFPKPLTPEIKKLYDEVLDDLNAPDETRESLKLMFTPGVDLTHFGYIAPKFKCLLCIPEIYEFKEPYDVSLNLQGPLKEVDLSSENGEDVRDAFVLSKKAQKYGIAKQICEAENPLNYAMSILPAFVIGINFVLLHKIHSDYQKWLSYSKWYKNSILGAIGICTVSAYLILKDGLNINIERLADEKVSLLGQDYLQGAAEFWEKKLWRSRIVRSHMIVYLRWMISEEGDYTQYFRRKHVPIVTRKKYFEKILSDYKIAQ